MNTGYNYKRLTKVLIITLVAAFSILIAGGFMIFKNEAPRPSKIVDQNGTELISKHSLLSGQAVYEKYGLADYGTYLGNGSYLGPDYTAQSLHVYLKGMDQYYAQKMHNKNFSELNDFQQGGIKAKVKKEIKVNRYSKANQTLTLTNAQAAGLKSLQSYYRKEFINNPEQAGLPASMINQKKTDAFMYKGNKVDQLTSFFFWGAWLSSTNRPGRDFTYTNNWPYDLDAGNVMPAEAMVWTAISVALLTVGVGVIIYFQRRYQFDMKSRYLPEEPVNIDPDVPITSSQRKTAKYFVIVMLMFLLQILIGELMAHYYVENSFFGIPLQNIWPFNVAKAWHLQLVIFWVATTWWQLGFILCQEFLEENPSTRAIWLIYCSGD